MRLLGAGTGKKEVEGREASLETAWIVRGRAHGMPCAFVRIASEGRLKEQGEGSGCSSSMDAGKGHRNASIRHRRRSRPPGVLDPARAELCAVYSVLSRRLVGDLFDSAIAVSRRVERRKMCSELSFEIMHLSCGSCSCASSFLRTLEIGSRSFRLKVQRWYSLLIVGGLYSVTALRENDRERFTVYIDCLVRDDALEESG